MVETLGDELRDILTKILEGQTKLETEVGNINTLLSSSLKSVPNDVMEIKQDIKELKERLDKVEKVTIQNTYDVAYLKSVK